MELKIFSRDLFRNSSPTKNLQHCFVAKKSTTSNLLSYSTRIHYLLESGMEVDSIYINFTKAFDKVSHQVIVEKFVKIGFGGNLLLWVKSFLSDRKYSARFGDSLSFEFFATPGVPAGTHGGPDLFLILINDLSRA
jgi:hypothetical protein